MKAINAKPCLSGHSQLAFRVGLARNRTASYPLDSMDFIMMDLERPDLCSRHAHWWTGDLTGRLIEFLSCAEGVDGKCAPRLGDFFERILRQRRPSGLFGRYACTAGPPMAPEDHPVSGFERLTSGLLRYYEISGDWRALEASMGIAEHMMSKKDAIHEALKPGGGNRLETWSTEHFARLYEITGDTKYLDFCAFFGDHVVTCNRSHSHGFMSAMRGLQLASLFTGDPAWNEKPRHYRRKIIDEHYEMPDGCVSEVFPRGFRNEGCSIADWLMMNLNEGLITGDESAYDKAENILWNALFFNQLVTGGFGHRDLTSNGYGMTGLSEAWWCCTEHCGMAMTEYAKHAVCMRGGTIHVNFLIPGTYTLPNEDGSTITVSVSTNYPANMDTVITIAGAPADADVRVRVPSCAPSTDMRTEQAGSTKRISISGKLGHWIEEVPGGVVLRYGPLVLSPSVYYWNAERRDVDSSVPDGYTPSFLPVGIPELLVYHADSEAFLDLDSDPLPDWSYYDEGPGSRLSVGRAAVNVRTRFENGEEVGLRFWPLCYNTSGLTIYEAPIVFKGIGKQ